MFATHTPRSQKGCTIEGEKFDLRGEMLIGCSWELSKKEEAIRKQRSAREQ
jgi:hypothetical protein